MNIGEKSLSIAATAVAASFVFSIALAGEPSPSAEQEPLACPAGTHPEAIATPLPTPTPTPVPTPPVPPQALKDPGPEDPEQLDIPLLDEALRGRASQQLLPFWHGYPWRKIARPMTWTRELHELLKTEAQEMVEIEPKDSALFCPNYRNLSLDQRRLVWLRLISVIASMESSLNPLAVFHSQRVQIGLYSAGLMMLSLPSSKQKRFGCTMIAGYDDIYDWRKNFACSVRIMKHYYLEDRSIAGHSASSSPDGKGRWMGLGRYWEPFRAPLLKTEEGAAFLLSRVKQKRKKWLAQAEGTKLHPAHRERAYIAEGELEIERIARVLNTMPLCLSGSPDEFEEPRETALVPLPRPRPKSLEQAPATPRLPKPTHRCVPD